LCEGQSGDGRGGKKGQGARRTNHRAMPGTEDGVKEKCDENSIKTVLRLDPSYTSDAHRLGDYQACDGHARDQVEADVFSFVVRQPCQDGEQTLDLASSSLSLSFGRHLITIMQTNEYIVIIPTSTSIRPLNVMK